MLVFRWETHRLVPEHRPSLLRSLPILHNTVRGMAAANAPFPDFECRSAFAAPCAKHDLARSFPANEVPFVSSCIYFVFVDWIFEKGYSTGELVGPYQSQAGCLQIGDRLVVAPSGEKALLVVKRKRIICGQHGKR